MTFREVEDKARSEWETLQNRIYITIGTATCGRAAGALDIADIINRELARRDIEAPVIQVGCMGLCYAEPLVIVCKPEFLRVKRGLLIKANKKS